jgi:hypothetical protein
MKTTFTEHEGCFSIEMTAETKEDVIALARFGINVTKKVQLCAASFFQDGDAHGSIILGKRKQSACSIP